MLGKTQAECKAKLSAAMEATRGIDVSRADEYTVATWLRSWYEIYAKPNIRISTANRYQLMVEQYTIPRIGSIKLTKLTAHDLQKLYKDLMENGRIDRKSGHAVINYDVPSDNEHYTHRIGRTGRAKKEGVSYLFYVPEEKKRVQELLRLTRNTDLCTPVHFDFNHEHIVVEKKQDSADRFQIKCYF